MLLGADPGLYGGLAAYDWRDNSATSFAMPLIEQKRNRKSPIPRLCTDGLLSLCSALAMLDPVACVLEDVHGYGGQGGDTSFVFGQAFGELRAALRAAGVPIVLAAPSAWKPRLGVPADKKAAVARAVELMPCGADAWVRHTVDDGPAEASLLAFYGAHVLGLDGCAPTIGRRRPRHRFTSRLLSEDITSIAR